MKNLVKKKLFKIWKEEFSNIASWTRLNFYFYLTYLHLKHVPLSNWAKKREKKTQMILLKKKTLVKLIAESIKRCSNYSSTPFIVYILIFLFFSFQKTLICRWPSKIKSKNLEIKKIFSWILSAAFPGFFFILWSIVCEISISHLFDNVNWKINWIV